MGNMVLDVSLAMPAIAAVYVVAAWPWLLGGLACLLLVSGIDDLIPLLICCRTWVFGTGARKTGPGQSQVEERRIAIFVPCWKESGVIERMVRENMARIRYRNFDFFLGVYANDQATADAASDVASAFSNVHVTFCANPGPTSKADCLNAIYEGMRNFETGTGVRFDTIVLHDAEDVIHADALRVINQQRASFEMVQVPVLPLATAPGEFTHGIYIDEFSEFQLIDMCARQWSGAFVPSNGVGTGFARDVLESLAAQRGGPVFDPSSLTEDYDIGLQIHYAGFRQLFYPLKRSAGDLLATREFFPRRVKTAIRQRTRWITGIALQSWERHGWDGSWRTRYWFWRDRKGLVTSPLSLLTNVVFLAGLTDWALSICMHRPWAFAVSNPIVGGLCWLTAGIQILRLAIRSLCVTKTFGARMGATVAVRCFHANFINCVAALLAIRNYTLARLGRKRLSWDKTDHAYPARMAEDPHRARLEDVLEAAGHVTRARLQQLRRSLRPGESLPDLLLAMRHVSEEDLGRAMSLQSGLGWSDVDVARVQPEVVRSLPARLERELKVLPFRVAGGRLHLATTRVPDAHVLETVSRFTRLSVEFQLVTRVNYARLRRLL